MRDDWDKIKPRNVAADVSEELRFHLEERIEELVAAGMSRADAEREARSRFGDLPAIGEVVQQIDRRMVRRRTLGDSLDALGRDIRFGLRALAKSPGFTLVAVLTLGLGIGANTAIFSAVNGVLLRPLDVPNLDRLFVVQQNMPGLKLIGGQLTPSQWEALARRTDLFDRLAGVSGSSANLTGSGEPQRIATARTAGGFFDVFSLRPTLGQFYRPEDSQNGNTKVVVLSNAFWRGWGGADPGVIGRSIELNGESYRVVGVLPASFRYRQNTQLFMPLEITERMRGQGPWMITTIGRLDPAVAPAQMPARIEAISREWASDPSNGYRPELRFSLSGMSLVDLQAGQLKPVLLLLVVAVGLVLLIACANVANLQLVRASGRSKELAVRAAMGAGRWPIMRQLAVENTLLAAAGGGLGLGIGLVAIEALRAAGSGQYPVLSNLRLDPPVLGFTAAITVLAVFLSGIAPTMRAARADLHGVLRDAGRGSSAGRGRNRLLRLSAATQVALSLMLLLGAGLLIRSLSEVLATDPGFESARVLTFRVAPSGSQQEERKVEFFNDLIARLAVLPGIESAGAISDLPFGEGENSSPFAIEGMPVDPGQPDRHADMRFVQGDYFKALGIPLLRGRNFGPEDRRGSPWVSVIDESLARQYFGAENPVGHVLKQGPTSTIVGVVGAVKHKDLTEQDKPTIYYTYSQAPWYPGLYVTIRTEQDPGAVLKVARATVAEIDAAVPVYDVSPMQDRVDQSLATRKLAMATLSGFAVAALLLALLGVYGVLSYSTSRRAHELGIRMALGAVPGDLIRMVLGSGLLLTLAGLAVGLAGFLLLAKLLSGILFGVSPRDPLTIVAGVVVLALGSALAAYIPARRAARVDPLNALREE